MMYRLLPAQYWTVLLWAILIAVSLYVRPLFPVDETRYAAVAWEMWLRHDFLVPHLNGETYSHKPPLLFWLMQLTWVVLGVNDWSLRLISPLFSLATLLLSASVAQALWPERKQVGQLAPLLLLGSLLWIVYSTLTMFDMMLAFFVLLGIYSLVKLANDGLSAKHWLLLGLAIGGGVLTKGPVVLLHLLPVALLAPWWRNQAYDKVRWSRWYSGLALTVLAGAVLALCWAIPAGIAGGEAYRNAIFLGQTSGRIVQSFAHRLPWWWYLERLPLLLLPWLLCKPVWTGLKLLSLKDPGLRFCLAWALPVFIAFSLVSGKRIHYLLPILPALAIVLAWAVDNVGEVVRWQKAHVIFAIVVAIIGFALALLPWLNSFTHWKDELSQVSPFWGSLLLVFAIAVSWVKASDAAESVFYTCIAAVALLLVISAGFFSIQAERYDTKIAGQQIAALMAENREIAYYGDKYHGQYHFAGRLVRPFAVIGDPVSLLGWAGQHPNGYIIVGYKNSAALPENTFAFHFPYRGQNIGLLAAQEFLKKPDLNYLFKG